MLPLRDKDGLAGLSFASLRLFIRYTRRRSGGGTCAPNGEAPVPTLARLRSHGDALSEDGRGPAREKPRAWVRLSLYGFQVIGLSGPSGRGICSDEIFIAIDTLRLPVQ